jgi:hypothetical protein
MRKDVGACYSHTVGLEYAMTSVPYDLLADEEEWVDQANGSVDLSMVFDRAVSIKCYYVPSARSISESSLGPSIVIGLTLSSSGGE